METTSYALRPISNSDATRLRDKSGPIYVADSVPGYPCRQCLRDAEIGEELILVSHDPFQNDSPYRSASPIFLHRTPCQPASTAELPLQLTRRQLSVRSFDDKEMMIDAKVIDGTNLAETLDVFFSKSSTARVHVHNAERGCWATDVERSSSHQHNAEGE